MPAAAGRRDRASWPNRPVIATFILAADAETYSEHPRAAMSALIWLLAPVWSFMSRLRKENFAGAVAERRIVIEGIAPGRPALANLVTMPSIYPPGARCGSASEPARAWSYRCRQAPAYRGGQAGCDERFVLLEASRNSPGTGLGLSLWCRWRFPSRGLGVRKNVQQD